MFCLFYDTNFLLSIEEPLPLSTSYAIYLTLNIASSAVMTVVSGHFGGKYINGIIGVSDILGSTGSPWPALNCIDEGAKESFASIYLLFIRLFVKKEK